MANCSFINTTPSFIAKDFNLNQEYERAKLCLIGDDLMSQLGGTAFHRGLISFLNKRGIKVINSYQLDVGGGSETLNTMDEEIRMKKKKIKANSILKELNYGINLVTGTTEYVEFMGNNRTSYFWIEGRGYLGSSIKIDIYLKSNDSENAGNILLDVIRATKRAKDMGLYGAVKEICAYGFKDPPFPLTLEEAYNLFSLKFLN
ncbi:Inositol-3-phosphate synthase [archaeon HR06]|nr:Inositol-3-phosphate synthase [archaeon HR06]